MQDQWDTPQEWAARRNTKNCPMCANLRSEGREDEYGFTVADMERSVLRLQRNQRVRGYCVLIAKKHHIEPFDMYPQERALFFEDMSRTAQAINTVFEPAKMNYEIMGNGVPHLHVHLVPRYLDDPYPHRRYMGKNSDRLYLDAADYARMVGDLREALGFIRQRVEDPLLINLLDNQGRVTRWPLLKNPEEQMAVRLYLASKFEPGRDYTEPEVNDLLNQWHTFEDWALLRRELFMHQLIRRMKDGSVYWVEAEDAV